MGIEQFGIPTFHFLEGKGSFSLLKDDLVKPVGLTTRNRLVTAAELLIRGNSDSIKAAIHSLLGEEFVLPELELDEEIRTIGMLSDESHKLLIAERLKMPVEDLDWSTYVIEYRQALAFVDAVAKIK